jgi:hypothetical protein
MRSALVVALRMNCLQSKTQVYAGRCERMLDLPGMSPATNFSQMKHCGCMQDPTRTAVELVCTERSSGLTFVEAVQRFVHEHEIDVAVLATDSVGQRDPQPVCSLTLALLRGLRDVNILVCKANSVGAASRPDNVQGLFQPAGALPRCLGMRGEQLAWLA